MATNNRKLIKVQVKGDKEMLAKVRALQAEMPDKVAGALFRACEKIMTKSKRDFVPIDLGELRDTGHVADPVVRRKKISCVLAYGGVSAPYAIVQHEDEDLIHPGQGESKYLEKPLKRAKIINDIAEDLKL